MQVKFTVYGKPQHKRRVRGSYIPPKGEKKGFLRFHSSTDEGDAETTISAIAMIHRAERLLVGPLKFHGVAVFPIPKSKSKKIKAQMREGLVRPTVKPDFDNIGKIYCDSFNGILYADDKLIVDGRIIKIYGEQPRVEIFVWEMTEEDLRAPVTPAWANAQGY